MNMKHGLYLFMFLLCGTGLQAQDRVVEQLSTHGARPHWK